MRTSCGKTVRAHIVLVRQQENNLVHSFEICRELSLVGLYEFVLKVKNRLSLENGLFCTKHALRLNVV